MCRRSAASPTAGRTAKEHTCGLRSPPSAAPRWGSRRVTAARGTRRPSRYRVRRSPDEPQHARAAAGGSWQRTRAIVRCIARPRRLPGELQISRDRLGVCPLYYFEGPPLIVASEIKAIVALENRARVPNLARVWRYLPETAIDDWSETFFLGVRPVPPATVLTMGNGRIAHSRFWTLARRPTIVFVPRTCSLCWPKRSIATRPLA
jgi:hypothetical protein